MSFLDDLKKSLSGAADYTAKKTTEVTGTAKIRLDIRSANSRLAKCYEKIGRAYYMNAKEAAEEQIAAMEAGVQEADAVKEEIAALRLQLAKLQACVICPACGAQVSDKSVFCPLCGVKLPKEEEAAAVSEEESVSETAEAAEEAQADESASEVKSETV
jgi:uncharacterized Zn finger protein (UPF0148 family)